MLQVWLIVELQNSWFSLSLSFVFIRDGSDSERLSRDKAPGHASRCKTTDPQIQGGDPEIAPDTAGGRLLEIHCCLDFGSELFVETLRTGSDVSSTTCPT